MGHLATNDANEHFHEIIVGKKKPTVRAKVTFGLRHYTVFPDPKIPGNVLLSFLFNILSRMFCIVCWSWECLCTFDTLTQCCY